LGKKAVSIVLEEELADALEKYSKRTGMSKSSVIRYAVYKLLKKEGFLEVKK